MRIILTTLAALVLAACGTTAQVEPAQTGTQLDVAPVPPGVECHIIPELGDGVLALRASDACAEHTILPARIHAPWGVVLDGGVYAGSVTLWPVRAEAGVYEVRRYDGRLVATVTVP